MDFLFREPMPLTWVLADLVVILVSILLLVYVIKKFKRPEIILLEMFAFVFLYASVYENAAGVQDWYIFGKSLVMIGDIPITIPLIEIDVLIVGLWMLDKMRVRTWCKPFILGLLGMLQDFTLDPLSVRQVYEVGGVVSGRWSWLIEPDAVNIYDVPVYNFPGWMLIMLYASTFILLGRWWFKRSGYKPIVGYLYPFLAMVLALSAMGSPLSRLLLWLGPFYDKGESIEWVMLAVNLSFPIALLVIFWRGRMKTALTIRDHLPILAVPVVLHLSDIVFTLVGGHTEILWLVLLVSCVHFAFLGLVYSRGRRAPVDTLGDSSDYTVETARKLPTHTVPHFR
jgi:hypothetical protein